MIDNTTAITTADRDFEPFPDFPPREDMQNWLHLNEHGRAYSLALHLGDPDTITAGSEIPLTPSFDVRGDVRIPDFMVSVGSHPSLIHEHRAYVIDRQGKPPDFVLEVASVSTGIADYTDKRDIYARYGVTEYWRYDPTGGEYHDAALAADLLVDGKYQPIEIEWLDENRCRGYSEALSLYLCWEEGALRFYDPATDTYLLTHDEEIRRADQAEAERDFQSERAERAEAERDFQAELVARESAARARAEAELQRLRERLSNSDAD